MKKIMITALLLGSATAYAGVDISGEGRVRHTIKNNKDFTDAIGDRSAATTSRFRLNFTGKKSEASKFTVFSQLQFVENNGTSGTTANVGLDVHQAYVNYVGGEYFNLTAGRFEVNLGDQLLFGGVGWSDEARSFNGVSIKSKCLISGTNTFYALKTNEAGTGPADEDVYGIYHAQSIGEYVKEFDLYYFNRGTGSGATEVKHNTFGLRLKDKKGSVDYRFEATAQNGENSGVDTQGNQFDLEVGYALPFMSSRLGVEYLRATKGYDQYYPTAHKWTGFADVFKRQNITGYVVHFKLNPTDKLLAKVDYHLYDRVSSDTAHNGLGTIGTDEAIGSEIDLTLKYTLEDGLAAQMGYSIVTAGDYLKAQGKTDEMNYSYFQIHAKF